MCWLYCLGGIISKQLCGRDRITESSSDYNHCSTIYEVWYDVHNYDTVHVQGAAIKTSLHILDVIMENSKSSSDSLLNCILRAYLHIGFYCLLYK